MTSTDTRRYRRGAFLLSLGVGSGGVLTYAYFALASHVLEPDRYGSLVVLWSVLFISVFTLYRPVEQYISRALSEQDARGGAARGALRVAATIQLGLAVAYVAAALLLRGPIEDGLLNGEGTLFTILVIAAPAYAVSFFARGYLAGRRRFGLYGAMLLLESTSRFAPALIAAVGLAEGVGVVSLGIVVAPLLSLVVVPVLVLRVTGGSDGANDVTSVADPLEAPAATLGAGGRFVGAAFAIMLSEQALLNVGVLVVGAAAGAAAAGFLFNVLLVARAPQVLFGAVTTSLLPTLTRLAAAGARGEEYFRGTIRGTIAGVAAAAAAAALVLAIAGPQIMQLTFGDDFDYDRAGLLIVVAGLGFHLTALTLTQAALAHDRAAAAAARWSACAIGFAALTLVPVLADVRRVEIGYAVATAALCALLVRPGLSSASARPRSSPAPLTT